MKYNLLLVATGALLAAASPVERRDGAVSQYAETPVIEVYQGDKLIGSPPPALVKEIQEEAAVHPKQVEQGIFSSDLFKKLQDWASSMMSPRPPKKATPPPPKQVQKPPPPPKTPVYKQPPQNNDDDDDDDKQTPDKPYNPPSSGSFEDEFVRLHNEKRALHGAQPLSWDAGLAAQAASDCGCDMVHHIERNGGQGYGQNIWTGKGPDFSHNSSPQNSVKSWYDEEKLYDYNSGVFSHEAGHFTQVVWASTTKLGCATVLCNKNQYSGWQYTVCNYGPPGNYQGRFQENVKPPVSRQ
ncbi:hypothetical protein CDD81_844 [Ophiocordyceps australis]|uniref:SCP domain-containing protein n=1 Tax=Ophiocordyceps australis TaxID=1399860 RepID=A0A2C5Y1C3_9HYPO|nr:hypothetical protein CDD81_844 [Ophiocordyceps australis]